MELGIRSLIVIKNVTYRGDIRGFCAALLRDRLTWLEAISATPDTYKVCWREMRTWMRRERP
jgi:hypothetical protein